MSVNKERVQLLVDALRSGEYIQGYGHLETNSLYRPKRHCCLGVACRVAMNNGLKLDVSAAMGEWTFFNRTSTSLPDEVMGWYGFDESDPVLIIEDEATSTAINLNDNRGYNFIRIADAFERTFLTD